MHLTDQNFVYFNISTLAPFPVTWPAGAPGLPKTNQLFVSYRVRQTGVTGYDSGLPNDQNRRVRPAWGAGGRGLGVGCVRTEQWRG